ncbi:cyclic nucleotide-binding protein [Kouleothrix aurantiaca]|uniref:Cyclic nucleotide-binding protein n=1 Tax=Kouleothrix aurantiaca TaxID=186479 RepID=A0A0P9HI31_9CHLR|nr:cyclic nucleotide-binding protein [Kouleothrix aurantiaca]
MIELRNVLKVYESAAGAFTALKSVNLQIARGEFVAIIGKSGSGKSTLINMITGIDRPSSGEVLVGDTALHTLSEGQMAVWRGRNLGIIFQFFQLLPALSIVENVMLPMDFCGMYTPRERRERAMMLLDQVGMADNAHKLPSAVSGGQQQRVAIARALANDPPVLIADEPTGNLDSKTADSVFRMFEQLANQGKTILMVTHDQDLARRVTRTVIIADGEVIDEYVARALPTLSEKQLIWASHNIETLSYPPGATIVHEGMPPENFYIITKGAVEIMLQQPGGSEIRVTTMGVGQYFGEIELLHGGRNLATIRAGTKTGVEVVALDRSEFTRLVTESPKTAQAIDQIAGERTAENLAARQVGEEVDHAAPPLA